MLAKPEPHKRVKARTKRQHATARKACQDAVWKRADHSCELCGRWVKRPRETDSVFDMGHIDEIIPRSLGGDDTNPDECRLTCVQCHFSGPSGAHRRTVRP